MKIQGSDGSKADQLREVGVGRLRGQEQSAVRGGTTDQRITTIARVLQARKN